MEKTEIAVEWLRRGRQRMAVAQVLRKPMTASDICTAAEPLNSRIQLRDIWFLMGQFEERALARCLNPRQKTGRLYCLTDYGRQVVQAAFGVTIKPLDTRVNWKKYSQVARARVRKLTLLTVAEMIARNQNSVAAAEIRKCLREKYPVGLNPVIRALKELLDLGLISVEFG